ncbi:Armadillo repeat-containing protein [Quillaja saponaria]|uniref:Armadillo repeat-containing protein n=1 Tax=Quillaja saponaria TaxID=32244 RepID=A0AAD7PG24_QUISA|nr:Armadillo repeat-containing protein [Quillaja saponaria]
MLRTMVRFATTTPFLYEPPIRHVVAEVSKNLERVLILVRKCKHQSFLRRVVNRVSSADFRKVLNILEASIGDMKWLINIFDADGDEGGKVVIQHSMPPIASNDPMLSWIWSDVATVQMGIVDDRCEAAKELASLAKDNDRNKKIIVEEGGVPPILKLFKESTLPEVQIEAATALYHLANNRERVRTIVNELAIPIIVQVLGDSSMGVQIQAASLVARMAEHDPVAQECFARENVIRPLVTLLSFETFVDDHTGQLSKQSIHSIVKINKEIEKNSLFKSNGTRPLANSYKHMEGISRVGHYSKKERENESPEIKLELKICCARALWMLATGSVSNSRKLTETKGLLCLAKIVEKDQGGLQFNCLMTIMEIAIAAESNADLRCAAFKTNSPAAKAVVDQLLRVIEELDNPSLQIPAIKSIGSLARTFPARETRVIGSLVTRLSHRNLDIAAEAAIALADEIIKE